MEQARIAARWAFDLPLQRTADSLPPYGVYSVPEVAMVGLTEEAAVGQRLDVRRRPGAASPRTPGPPSRGRWRAWSSSCSSATPSGSSACTSSERRATELVHQGQAVIHFGGTIEYFINSTFNVPTMSEAYKYAAYDGLRQVGA